MTTTTTFQGMEPGSKSSSRVLRPPGGASNICFGSEEEKPVRKNKMASNIFAGPDDPHAHRRNNPPSGEASGVLCGESSAPLRRCPQSPIYTELAPPPAPEPEPSPSRRINKVEDQQQPNDDGEEEVTNNNEESSESSAAPAPTGRRNPPGGKSSVILG
ncbi:jupiter microtubule associated homolog 1b [Engraulis encrasicolus]|uniref:jupiter microtubule associated homolog 1b n=1 Tax=Engraulis encrasicolus TaxID=184585 RepID=UPI002FD4BB9D